MRKNFVVKFLILIILLLQIVSAHLAKTQSEGGSVGSDFSTDSKYAHGSSGAVNLFTGAPYYHMNLMNISTKSGLSLPIDLNYCGSVESQALRNNTIAPATGFGLGWYMGLGTIYVDHHGTVDMSDDEYFMKMENGTISAIVRQGTNQATYTYQIKNYPYWKISPPQFNGVNIDGWTIVKPDGTIYKFGFNIDAKRFIPMSSDASEFKYDGDSKFYYQWDLCQIQDVNDGKLNFVYNQLFAISALVHYDEECLRLNNGWLYSSWWDKQPSCPEGSIFKEVFMFWWLLSGNMYEVDCCRPAHDGAPIEFVNNSYLSTITNDCGEEVVFFWDLKSSQEIGSNSFSENKFLKRIDLRNVDDVNVIKNRLTFVYSGDPQFTQQVEPLNSGSDNEKRLLTRIMSQMGPNELDRVFEYSRQNNSPGLLTTIVESKTGKTTSFKWGLHQIRSKQSGKTYNVNVVDRLVQSGGIQSVPSISESYSYTTNNAEQEFEPGSGIPYWGKITTTLGASLGSIVTSFEVDNGGNKFGTCKSVETYNANGKLISSENYDYTVKTFGPTGNQWFIPMLAKTTKTLYGVSTLSGTATCNGTIDENSGATTQSWVTGNDGNSLITKRTFAYQEYSEMGTGSTGKNMLIQEASNKLIKVTGYNPATCDITSGTVVKASFTTWSKEPNDPWGVIRARAKYEWCSDMNSSGVPINVFVDFNKSSPTANGWKLQSVINKYNEHGQPLQVTNARGLVSATIYSTPYSLPVASIVNAAYDECAVYTGVYSFGSLSFENGWDKGELHGGTGAAALNVDASNKHFGEKSLLVKNADGPIRKVYVRPGCDYIFSAWIRPISANPIKFGAEVHIDDGASISHDLSVVKSGLILNQWQLISLPLSLAALSDIKPAGDGTKNDYVQISIGNSAVMAPSQFFVDDIRFYPKNSFVTTTYYSDYFGKPIIIVDSRGNSGPFIEYDSPDFPARAFKFDKTKNNDATGAKIPLTTKVRHYLGADLWLVKPNCGEVLRGGEKYSIAWSGRVATTNVFFFDGSTWSNIATLDVAEKNYLWMVPSMNVTGCKIKIQDNDNPSIIDESDGTFSISTYLKITRPGQNEYLWSGKRWAYTVPILWNSTGGSVSNVMLEYYDGTNWEPIISSTANDGSYDWCPLNIASIGYTRIRISEAGTGNFANVSEPFYLYENHGYIRRSGE